MQGIRISSRSGTSVTPGRARVLFLLALLVLGAAGAFYFAPQRVPAPDVANIPAEKADVHRPAAAHEGHGAEHAVRGPSTAAGTHPVTPATVEKEWGLRVTRLTLIADGGLVDLRYRVTDPRKAAGILDPDRPVYLLEEEAGKAVATARFPKIGNLRTGDGAPEAGTEYFMGFGNPDGLFEPGDRATLAVGPDRLAHVPVR